MHLIEYLIDAITNLLEGGADSAAILIQDIQYV